MNTTVTSIFQQGVPQAITTSVPAGESTTSVTTTPIQSQFFVNTSAAGINEPAVMTATQNLSQNPLEATAQLLINSASTDFLEACAKQDPVSGIFAKIAELLGLAEPKTAESTSQSPALNQLRAMIESARPDYKALSQEVAQALEAKSQGHESSNSYVAQAVNQVLEMFHDEIRASGSLMHFLEVAQKKEALVQVATAITYQTQLMSRVYLQLQHTQAFQALNSSANVAGLHNALSNLQLATANFGAPQAVAEMMQEISGAVIQMITNVKQAGKTFARQMGQVELSSKPAPVPVSTPSVN